MRAAIGKCLILLSYSFLDGDGQPRYRRTVLDPELWQAFSASFPAYLFSGLLGALWGSFGNVCIYRMPPSEEYPNGRSVSVPPSHCFVCKSRVRWYDNVPLLSYLWLRGQCRDCKTQFSPRYLLVEAGAALLFVGVHHLVVAGPMADLSPAVQLQYLGAYFAFSWFLLINSFIDLDHKLILDRLTYPALPIFFALGVLLPGTSWSDCLWGVLLGYGIVRLIADGFWFLTGREGMGYGDGKLLAIIGGFLGWQAVLVSLFLGAVIGVFVTLILLALTKRGSSGKEGEASLARAAVPFGPFLAVASLVYLFAQTHWREILSPLY